MIFEERFIRAYPMLTPWDWEIVTERENLSAGRPNRPCPDTDTKLLQVLAYVLGLILTVTTW